MLTAVEGLYKNGHVELLEMPVGVMEPRVLVTFVVAPNDEPPQASKPPGQMIRLGQFPGTRQTSEEDFKLAEWHGEPEFDE